MNLRRTIVEPLTDPLTNQLLKLFVRIALAAPFFLSGRTKVIEGTWFSISETTYTLFENDYSAVPLPPHLAAVMATVAEHLLPALLVFGLGTRLAALGLVGMTLAIQIFVFPDAWWGVHMQWTALALTILLLGPGKFSVDRFLFGGRAP